MEKTHILPLSIMDENIKLTCFVVIIDISRTTCNPGVLNK